MLPPELALANGRDIAVLDALGTPIGCHMVKLPQMRLTALGNIDQNRLMAFGQASRRATVEWVRRKRISKKRLRHWVRYKTNESDNVIS